MTSSSTNFPNYFENVKYKWNILIVSIKEFIQSLNCSNALIQTVQNNNELVCTTQENYFDLSLNKCNDGTVSFKTTESTTVKDKTKKIHTEDTHSNKSKSKSNRSRSRSPLCKKDIKVNYI